MFSSALRIFSPKQELLLLALPIFFLIASLVQWSIALPVSEFAFAHLMVFVKVVFLQDIHIILSFYLALAVPEYKSAIGSKWKQHSTLIILGATVLFIVMRHLELFSTGWTRNIVASVIIVYVSLHSLRQSLGISLLYNVLARQSGRWTGERLAALNRNEKRERLYITLSFFMVGAGFFIPQVWPENPVARFMPTFFAGVTAVFMFHLIWLYGRLDIREFPYKMLFWLRLGLTAMISFSPIAFIGSSATHGVEYGLIYNRIRGHTKDRRQTSVLTMTLLLVTWVVIAAGTYFDPKMRGLGGHWDSPVLLNILLVASGAMALFHVFLDRLLFQMKRAEVRVSTGAWLLSDFSNSSSAGKAL